MDRTSAEFGAWLARVTLARAERIEFDRETGAPAYCLPGDRASTLAHCGRCGAPTTVR